MPLFQLNLHDVEVHRSHGAQKNHCSVCVELSGQIRRSLEGRLVNIPTRMEELI